MIGIGLTGLASGLDTEALISSLMQIERRPRVRLELRQDQIDARKSALADINSRLKSLKTAAADLRSVLTWAERQTVESSSPTQIGARIVSGAGPGGYQVEVSQLARAEQRTYAYTADASATTIDIDGVVIDIAANATLDDVVTTINGRSDSPVYAAAVNGALVLSSRTTGAANGFSATGTTIAEDAAKAKVGLDATYTVDGGAPQTSSSNVVTDAIPGVELTFKAQTTSAVSVVVSAPATDRAAVKDKVKAFVEQYNSTIEFIRGKLNEKTVPEATSSTDRRKGALHGDSMLTGLVMSLRTKLTEAIDGNPAELDQLMEIGVTTGAATGGAVSQGSIAGKLVLDEAKLDAALNSNLSDVKRLLGGVSGVDGIAQKVEALIDPATTAGGTLDSRISEADKQIERLKDSMAALDLRLADREKRFRAQFSALERILSQSQSQARWLSGQLANL